jgi:hypothetical protein
MATEICVPSLNCETVSCQEREWSSVFAQSNTTYEAVINLTDALGPASNSPVWENSSSPLGFIILAKARAA